MFPFSSDLKHMTTATDVEGRLISYIKGSPELIMSFCDMTEEEEKTVNKLIEDSQRKAMLIIAFAHKRVQNGIDYSDDTIHAKMESHMVLTALSPLKTPFAPKYLMRSKPVKKRVAH